MRSKAATGNQPTRNLSCKIRARRWPIDIRYDVDSFGDRLASSDSNNLIYVPSPKNKFGSMSSVSDVIKGEY